MFKIHRSFDLNPGIKGTTIAVFNNGKVTSVMYHKTEVFNFDGKKITLKTGGWDTVSTRIVMNQALKQAGLPWQVRRVKGVSCVMNDNTGIMLPLTETVVLR